MLRGLTAQGYPYGRYTTAMHLFYVDESGQRDYNPKNSQHFVLSAVTISDTDWREWNQKINAIKEGCFGTTQVEWKSVNLRQPDKCRRFYLEPFGITQGVLTAAVEQMYTLINEAPLTLSCPKRKAKSEDGRASIRQSIAYMTAGVKRYRAQSPPVINN